MAVGGMPQAVDAYINKNSFEDVDRVKREIISLYEDDFHKIDPSGRISNLYEAVPSQLSSNKNRFIISNALGKRTTNFKKILIKDSHSVFIISKRCRK